MKLLDQKQYDLIFFNAIQYDSVDLIAAYFQGKFEEVKKCNPIELYIDGLTKSFVYFKEFHEKFELYFQIASEMYPPGFETMIHKFIKFKREFLTVEDLRDPGFFTSDEFKYFIHNNCVLEIKQGFDLFKESLEKTFPESHQLTPEHEILLKEIRNLIQRPAPVKSSNLTTFSCRLTRKPLKALYDSLIKHGFIDPGTDQDLFIKVFSGVPVGELTGKIKWIDLHKNKFSNKLTLLELICGLYPDLNASTLYDKIISCFSDKSGEKIKRDSLKQSFSNWKGARFSRKSDREIEIQSLLPK